jgi:hypothetical protein
LETLATKISGKIDNTKRVAIPPYGIRLNVVTQEWCEVELWYSSRLDWYQTSYISITGKDI